MSNFRLGVPVKTRVPPKVWALAVVVTLFSLASSLIHFPAASGHAVFAGVTVEHGTSRGS